MISRATSLRIVDARRIAPLMLPRERAERARDCMAKQLQTEREKCDELKGRLKDDRLTLLGNRATSRACDRATRCQCEFDDISDYGFR